MASLDKAYNVSAVVKQGMERVCGDFDVRLKALGFKRTRAKGREWRRQTDDRIERILVQRSGSSYGAPYNASVSLSVRFSAHPVDATPPLPLDGPDSDRLRDARGYACHLRFNAWSWSTYDRCVEDLSRVLDEHGLPWFRRQAV